MSPASLLSFLRPSSAAELLAQIPARFSNAAQPGEENQTVANWAAAGRLHGFLFPECSVRVKWPVWETDAAAAAAVAFPKGASPYLRVLVSGAVPPQQ